MTRHKIEYLLLALIGLTMMLVAGYTQWISIDVNQYSLTEYLAKDIWIWNWWTIVGIPFLAGCVYFGAAIFGMRSGLSGNSVIGFFVGCLAFGIVLLSIGGLGYFATISCALVLAYAFLKHRK